MENEKETQNNGEIITDERAREIIKSCREMYKSINSHNFHNDITEQDITKLMTLIGGISVLNESVEAEKIEEESDKKSNKNIMGQLIKLCIDDLKETKELLKTRRELTEQERRIEEKVSEKMKGLLGAINPCISEFEQRYLIERAQDDKEIGD